MDKIDKARLDWNVFFALVWNRKSRDGLIWVIFWVFTFSDQNILQCWFREVGWGWRQERVRGEDDICFWRTEQNSESESRAENRSESSEWDSEYSRAEIEVRFKWSYSELRANSNYWIVFHAKGGQIPLGITTEKPRWSWPIMDVNRKDEQEQSILASPEIEELLNRDR
jgi:hypothetical protein